MLCIGLRPCQKSDRILVDKVALNLKFSKKCAPKLLFFIEKENWNDSNDSDDFLT